MTAPDRLEALINTAGYSSNPEVSQFYETLRLLRDVADAAEENMRITANVPDSHLTKNGLAIRKALTALRAWRAKP